MVSMPGEVKDPTYQSALEMCTLPWAGPTQETEHEAEPAEGVCSDSEPLTLSMRSGRVGPQLYHSNLGYR